MIEKQKICLCCKLPTLDDKFDFSSIHAQGWDSCVEQVLNIIKESVNLDDKTKELFVNIVLKGLDGYE